MHLFSKFVSKESKSETYKLSDPEDKKCCLIKSRVVREVLFEKLFNGYIFLCSLGHSVDRYVFELFVLETNLKKKRSVRSSHTAPVEKLVLNERYF